MTHIFHITTRSAAQHAQSSGEYRTESLSSEGFIHCSQIFQVEKVANAFYKGQADLLIMVIDPARVHAQVKFEAPVHPRPSESAPEADSLFPHIYGPLNMDAVLRLVDLPAKADGSFELPSALSA